MKEQKEILDEQIRIFHEEKDSLTVSRRAFKTHYSKRGYRELGDDADDNNDDFAEAAVTNLDNLAAVTLADKLPGVTAKKAREVISGKPVKAKDAEEK